MREPGREIPFRWLRCSATSWLGRVWTVVGRSVARGFGRPGSRSRLRHPARVLLALVALTQSLASEVQGVDPFLSHLEPNAEQELEWVDRLLDAGRTLEAVGRFQALNDRLAGTGAIVPFPTADVYGVCRVYRPAVERLTEFARTRAEAFREIYRREYESRASAMLQRGLDQRDAALLLDLAERYPVAESAVPGVLAAGDLLLESGQVLAARSAWRQLPWSTLPPELRPGFVRRSLLAASLLGDERDHARWSARAVDMGMTVHAGEPCFARTLEPRAAAAPNLATGVDPATASIELAWTTRSLILPIQVTVRSGDRARRAMEPCVSGERVFLVTFDRVHVLDLQTGLEQARIELPVPDSYREFDADVRLRPLAVEDLLVVPYVASVSPKEGDGWGSGVVKMPIAKRALRVLRRATDGTWSALWDTHGLAVDTIMAQLSFGPQALVVDDTLYALGWRSSGYIDVFVAAFDLHNGDLRWRTLIGSGQVDRTRFGELASEPMLGGLAHEHGNVLVATQLGLCAALRAQDGSSVWITQYEPVRPPLELSERRRLRFPYQRESWWEPGAWHRVGDWMLVAPQDSPYLLGFDPEIGKIVQRRRASSTNSHVLGTLADSVVVSEPSWVRRVPGRELGAQVVGLSLDPPATGRPALYEEGLVYAASDGLYVRPFDHEAAQRMIAFPTPKRTRSREWTDYDGSVTLAGDMILVANTVGVVCYRLSPRE